MRLPADVRFRTLALGLTAALAGCGLVGGGDRPEVAQAGPGAAAPNGPAADYPMVLGEPFTVEGELYTPADTLNYDTVGYAVADAQGEAGVSASHKTLPLPSYIEVTSLDNGKTILARAERRGPMSGALVALSPGALAQLGIAAGAPVRVRRVNPPEVERAELRAGRPAPERLETPKSLVEVLRRKLPADGFASLRTAAAPQPAPAPIAADTPRMATRPAPVAQPSAEQAGFAQAFPAERTAVTAYPLAPLARASQIPASTATRAAVRQTAVAQQPVAGNGYVIQAAAFSSKANADRAAGRLGGFVTPSGSFYRVRTGPYATRGQAEAALAKVRAAGYSDARVFTAG